MNEFIHLSEKDVEEGRFTGEGYVFYRFPDADCYTFVSQQGRPEELVALDVSDSFSGIVIAPFSPAADCPIVLLRPDYSQTQPVNRRTSAVPAAGEYTDDQEERRKAYAQSFQSCHQWLLEGTAQKIVLSRRLQLDNQAEADWCPTALFHEACRRYPHNYITLWWTRRTGCWLVATPETILRNAAEGKWQTMALAGTMKWEEYQQNPEEAWTEKNKEEQAYVSDYIRQRLLPFTQNLEISDTYTKQSAEIVHLCTDFVLDPLPGVTLGQLLQQLHPTPAVGGVPQEKALQAIEHFEDSPRKYYGGFSGPVNWNGESQLYVSLRCMQISPRQALLYAGGGLLKHSREEEEWKETQRKMNTMLHLFN